LTSTCQAAACRPGTSETRGAILGGVTSETLADIIRAHQAATGDSSREMQAKARRKGLRLSFTTVNSILNGDHTGSYKPYTLDALAAVCGLPPARVYQAAGRALPAHPFAAELPEDVDELDASSRKAVIGVIRAMLRLQEISDNAGPADVGPSEQDARTGPCRGRSARRARPLALGAGGCRGHVRARCARSWTRRCAGSPGPGRE